MLPAYRDTNGITLCSTCHDAFFLREEEYADILKFVSSIPVEVWTI
jgi:hypothetical protein